jgi:hypothetical protein
MVDLNPKVKWSGIQMASKIPDKPVWFSNVQLALSLYSQHPKTRPSGF